MLAGGDQFIADMLVMTPENTGFAQCHEFQSIGFLLVYQMK